MAGEAFAAVAAQPQVRELLRASAAGGRLGQAYLFCGPAGSGKKSAAVALAQAALCPEGGCGACDVCARIARGRHPDVRFFAPEGAGGYLVEQIRAIVADVALAPIQGARKVYVLDRADLLGVQAANAFLKTLEEPPADATMVLLARTADAVLPTIASRCQVVSFRAVAPSEAEKAVMRRAGATEQQARIALAACDGSAARAEEFLASQAQREFRLKALDAMARLRTADDWELLCAAATLTEAAKAPLDEVRAAHERELAENADFLAKSAVRQIEARNKRELTAKSAESLRQLTAVVRSWLRDVLALCAEMPEQVVNVDAREALEDAASATDEARAAAALAAPRRCDEAIAGNVSPETCVGAMLFEMRDALFGAPPRFEGWQGGSR